MFKLQRSTFNNVRYEGSSGDVASQSVMLYPLGGYQVGSAGDSGVCSLSGTAHTRTRYRPQQAK
jgi:hypothetical protein